MKHQMKQSNSNSELINLPIDTSKALNENGLKMKKI